MFTERSIWTMVHGIALSGGALLGIAAALFHLYACGGRRSVSVSASGTALSRLTSLTAVMMWATVLVGTYVVFPAYRAMPPEGLADLAAYPRAMILADPENAWLHSFGMEIKEHVPWIAAMLVTAVAFVSLRYRGRLLSDARLRGAALTLLGIALALTSATGLLGILVNKFAPLE
jgi:hypothetical protein